MGDFIPLLTKTTLLNYKNGLTTNFKQLVNYLKKYNNHNHRTYSPLQPLPAYVLTTPKPASHESTITTH